LKEFDGTVESSDKKSFDKKSSDKEVHLKSSSVIWKRTKIPYQKYLTVIPDEDRKREEKKDYHITFLTFQSGKVIQTGPIYEIMEIYYKRYITILTENRKLLEEVILPPLAIEETKSLDNDVKGQLGQGIYGTVVITDGKACKKVEGDFEPSTMREIDLLLRIRSPYLVPFLGYAVNKSTDGINPSCTSIFMSPAKCDLERLSLSLERKDRVIFFPKVFEHVVKSVWALNSVGIFHRDIKPSNFLVYPGSPTGFFPKGLPGPVFTVKICDFSISMDQRRKGGVSYAPNFKHPRLDFEDCISEETEIFATAATLITFLTGRSVTNTKYLGQIKGLKVKKIYKDTLVQMLSEGTTWVKIFTPNVLKLIGPLVGTEVKNSLPDKIQEKKLHPRIYSIVENLDIDIYVLNLTYRLVSRLQEKNIVIDTLTQFACFCIASLYYDFEIPFALISDVCDIKTMKDLDLAIIRVLEQLEYKVMM